MRLFKTRRPNALSERLFRIRRNGYLKRNIAEGKREYSEALKEFTAKNKMLQGLLRERARLLESYTSTPKLREKLTRLDNMIAGVQDKVQIAMQTQKRASEMILHAEKELGIRPAQRRVKKAA